MTKSKGLIRRVPWTPADDALIREHFATMLTAELAELLGRSEATVSKRAQTLGVRKNLAFIAQLARDRALTPGHGGERTRFAKGIVPANKGIKRPPGWAPGDMALTQFKKGRPACEARNYKPIGSLRVNADGHLERKVTDDPSIFPVRRWVPVYRLVWAEVHGEIPPGHMVRFKPGMSTAELGLITVDKLECISRQEHMRRHTYHQYGTEVAHVVQLRGAITRQINKRAKEGSES